MSFPKPENPLLQTYTCQRTFRYSVLDLSKSRQRFQSSHIDFLFGSGEDLEKSEGKRIDDREYMVYLGLELVL